MTMVDLFSNIAMAYLVQERSSEVVLEAIRTWFQFYDGGKEFDNVNIRVESRNLGIEWHIDTPGHPKSKNVSIVSDHLRIYHVEEFGTGCRP